MRVYKKTILRVDSRNVVLVLLLCFASVSNADDLYLGFDYGALKFDQVEFDSVHNSSFLIGYQFTNWGVEGSYHYSKTENDFFGGDQKIEMYHLYSVYRSADEIYYKFKLGLTNERYQFFDNSGDLKVDDVHTGVARGVGVGYRIKNYNLELEYNWIGGSLEMFSAGIKVNL